MNNQQVLVLGAGVAGMEASLLLAGAGRTVHLVEKESMIGGQTIKFEEVYPNMECSTCMVAPRQQEVLQNGNIKIHFLSEIEKLEGTPGNFQAAIRKRARFVSLTDCIGCGACYEPCPVSLDNEFEEGLSTRKAIAVPCAGALPNVPGIDPERCLRLNGKDNKCQACKDACVFDAIRFEERDETVALDVGAVVVATGFDLLDVTRLPRYGYGKAKDVYTALEFERLFASNGPTEGKLRLRNGNAPKSVGIIHCVGRSERGYCSGICCMYSAKFSQFIKHKIPEARVCEFHTDLCLPGKAHQKFYEKTRSEGVEFIRAETVEVASGGDGTRVIYRNGGRGEGVFEADMVILSPAVVPKAGTEELAAKLGLQRDGRGFLATRKETLSPVETDVGGVFVVGCAQGPMDIPESIAQAQAAAGKILSLLSEGTS
jgi:heterodisulfide reductase subunit A